MSTPEVIYELKLELNKLDSQDFIDLPLPTLLTVLNKGVLMYEEAVYGIDNIFREGVESSQRRVDDLQELLINSLSLPSYTDVSTESEFKFEVSLPDNYLHLLRSFSVGTKDICKDRPLKNIEYSQDELNDILITKDPNRYPSFEWQEVPINISNNKIIAYTDGTFELNNAYVSYLKYPVKLDISGYTHINGDLSTDVNPELTDVVMQEIITLTAKFIKNIISDVQGELLEKDIRI